MKVPFSFQLHPQTFEFTRRNVQYDDSCSNIRWNEISSIQFFYFTAEIRNEIGNELNNSSLNYYGFNEVGINNGSSLKVIIYNFVGIFPQILKYLFFFFFFIIAAHFFILMLSFLNKMCQMCVDTHAYCNMWWPR